MPLTVMALVLMSAILHAAWNGMVKGGSDRYLDTTALLIGGAVLCGASLLFLPAVARACWSYMALSAFIHFAYFSLIALSYRDGDMSVVYPITRGAAPALTALGSVLLLDRTHSGEWAGVALISSGVILLAFDHGKQSDKSLKRAPIGLALLNSVVIACYTLVDGRGARLSHNALAYTCWDFVFTAAIFVPVGFAIRGKAQITHLRGHWRRGALGAACSVGAYAIALWAMTQASISAVAALRETAILFGVLLAALRLQETVSRTRWIAAILVVAGAVAIKLW